MSSINVSSTRPLQDVATISIAQSMWSHRISLYDPATFDYDMDDCDDVGDLFAPFDISSIPLPGILKTKLKEHLDALREEIDVWMVHHRDRFFPMKEKIYMLPCLKHLVWRYDGLIDYESTARKLLQVDYLKNLEKDKMAGTFFIVDYLNEKYPYCSIDEIKRETVPRIVLLMIYDEAERVPSNQQMKFHEKSETFLKWYYADDVKINDFKSSEMWYYRDCSCLPEVRTILYGMGDGAASTQ